MPSRDDQLNMSQVTISQKGSKPRPLTRPSTQPAVYSTSKVKLPEKQLLSRYRHVYAGRGGWFTQRTTMTPPVNFNSNRKYLDVYRKELILRLTRDIFENTKPSLKKDSIVSNQVIGDQRDSPLEQQNLNTKLNSSTRTGLKEISSTVQIQEKRINSSSTQNLEKSQAHIIHENTTGIDKIRADYGSKQEEDLINNTSNERDNCFVTCLKRAHTIIGTIHPSDNQSNGNEVTQVEHSKQDSSPKGHDAQCTTSNDLISNGKVNENVCPVNTTQTGESQDKQQYNLKPNNLNNVSSYTKDTLENALEEIEFNILRQRSFVRNPSKMAVEQRPFSRGTLTQSGKCLQTRMSQEALLAIDETRREMGIQPTETPAVTISPLIQSKTDITNPVSEPVEQLTVQNESLEEPSCDSAQYSKDTQIKFENGYENNKKFTSKRELHLLQRDTKKREERGHRLSAKSTEATPISSELKLMSVMNKQRKQDTARYSFNLSRDAGPRCSSKRSSKSSVNLARGAVAVPNHINVFTSPRTKLPHLKLKSQSTEELDAAHDSQLYSPRVLNKEAMDTVAPLQSKTLPNMKLSLVMTKEKSFQITPPGWDVRYRDTYRKKVQDFTDDTPEEVKERAIEKCSDWLTKYM